jgi:putative redox protein
MSKLSPDVKPFFEKMRTSLAQYDERLATNTAEASLMENQRSEVKVRGFTLVQDEPESVLGTGKGPTPTDFFIASVALCENVVFARTAAISNVSIESLETVASGVWDMKGLFEVDGADPFFKRVIVETKVQTRSTPSDVAAVARLTHRRCPVHATLRRSTELVFKLRVNGVDTSI